MRPPRRSALAAGLLAGAVLLAWPVIGQEGPKSLLPDAADAPAAPPAAEPAPLRVSGDQGPPAAETVSAAADPAASAAPSAFDLPAAVGASVEIAGPLTPAMGGYGLGTFAASDGRFLAGLLRRLDTPLASRWAHIVLRRALLSQSSAPQRVAPADWIALRADVLLRLGEADGAVLLVDAVPVDRFTPSLYRVAGQAHLAAADPAGLCPFAQTGTAVSRDPLWRLAVGMCGGMAGDDLTSAATFDSLRGRGQVERFDLQLGERVATLSGGGGRAANIEWETAPGLTPYRFGIAAAAGVRIPDARLAGFGVTRQGWVLRAPGISDSARLAAVLPAAALGIASTTELVSTISATASDAADLDSTPAGDLRAAFAAASLDDRYAALKSIRDAAKTPLARYAALLETSMPAARLPVDKARAADAPEIVAALLAGGQEARAAAWWRAVQGDDTAKAKVWGLLAAAGMLPATPDQFTAWRKADGDPHRAALLLAGLDALGRTRGDWTAVRQDAGLTPVNNSWTRAIGSAAAAGRTGAVTFLAAIGLQSAWTAVPPAQLGAIVAAYDRIGLHRTARLLLAEAVTRG